MVFFLRHKTFVHHGTHFNRILVHLSLPNTRGTSKCHNGFWIVAVYSYDSTYCRSNTRVQRNARVAYLLSTNFYSSTERRSFAYTDTFCQEVLTECATTA